MWPPGAYTPQRVPLPYPPYGTLNFFDQTGKEVLDGIKSHRGTAIRAAADRPRDRRALLGRGQLARTRRTTPRDHRLRLRDRRHHYTSTGAKCAGNLRPGQQPPFGDSTNDCSTTRASTRRWSSRAATTACCSRRWNTRTTRRAPVVDAVVDGRRDQAGLRGALQEQRGVLDLLHAPTARRRRRPRPSGSRRAPARCRWRSSSPPRTTLKWIAHDFKGNMSAVKTQMLGDVETPAPSAAPCRRR